MVRNPEIKAVIQEAAVKSLSDSIDHLGVEPFRNNMVSVGLSHHSLYIYKYIYIYVEALPSNVDISSPYRSSIG